MRFRVGHDGRRRSTSRGGRIAARARRATAAAGAAAIEADWFVCAMPVERARTLLVAARCSRSTRRSSGMDELFVDWMNGIQFYLRAPVDITHGHVTFVDAPWALTALTQAQFWADRDFARDYGDGTAVDCLSVDISDWDTPGILYGKPAKQCTREEIAHGGLGADQGAPRRHRRAACPTTSCTRGSSTRRSQWAKSAARNRNDEPLLVNTVGSWEKRPKARDRRSRTCSSPATTCRPTSTSRRWRARTSPAARRSTRCSTRSGSKAEPRADVQALRPAGVRGGQARRRASSTRPASRTRSTTSP